VHGVRLCIWGHSTGVGTRLGTDTEPFDAKETAVISPRGTPHALSNSHTPTPSGARLWALSQGSLTHKTTRYDDRGGLKCERRGGSVFQRRNHLETTRDEMQAYYDARSETWQQGERAAVLLEQIECLEQALEDLPPDEPTPTRNRPGH
jgi:hypothetical protein